MLRLSRALFAITFCTAALLAPARAAEPPVVTLNWLNKAPPPAPTGVSWGVPWPRGTVQKTDTLTLRSSDGKNVPLQVWPMAYWPDGSIKWTGLATTVRAGGAAPYQLSVAPAAANTPPADVPPIRAEESPQAITITSNRLACIIPRSGENLFTSLAADGKIVARDGRLTCILQNTPEDVDNSPPKLKFTSNVTKVTLEQSGPVRAVVKLEGMHRAINAAAGATPREWLPFVVRLYFYANENAVKMVHTIIYDGDQEKDFIRGLGFTASVPFREEIQNRHVRFANSNGGLWSEPIQPLMGRDNRFIEGPNGNDVYPDQIAGRRVPNRAQAGPGVRWLDQWAIWDDFKLSQPNAHGFTIVKRTNPQSTWLQSEQGHRAAGLVHVGDVSGGLSVSLRNFWQSYPASLEVKRASSPAAEVNVWLWSPDAPAMDMRHYDTRPHGLEASYEDVQPGFWTATGVARTSELTLVATPDLPSKPDVVAFSHMGSTPPLLVATPQHIQSTGVFGIWSVKDTSTPFKKAVEDGLDSILAYYLKEVDQSNWYGFWHYGNVMHSYDVHRHKWRYDVGGMAWANSELGPDLWLWYSFLRSGRADIYRMAEAMTRNTGEVASYHLGRFAGLGTRHGVIIWGDGAKEARISQAAYRRFHYYLSTDERTGDIMREVVNADFAAVGVDPMRIASPPTPEDAKFPTRVRAGPDWIAFVGNWMTEWERTGDTKWRDKILVGAKCMAEMPYGFRTGTSMLMGYDPKTGMLYQRNNNVGNYNLSTIMGGGEVGIELDQLIDDPHWRKVWRQFCRLYSAPAAVITRDMQTGNEAADAQYATNNRLAGYAYRFTGNPAFAARALGAIGVNPYVTRPVGGPDVLNPIDEARGNTNSASQDSLVTIELLELLKDRLPTEAPPPRTPGGRRGGGRGRGQPAATAPAAPAP